MNAIEKIIAQLNEQAAKERAALEKSELQRLQEKFEQKNQQLLQEKKRLQEKQAAAIDDKYKQLHDRQQVAIRQETLAVKQEFLTRLFEEAAAQMAAWDQKKLQEFALSALYSLPINGEAKLLVGSLSASALNASWLAEIAASLPYKLVLAERTLPQKAGFICDDQGIQYNFIFENLVQDIQTTCGYEFAQRLFSQEGERE